VTLVEYGDYECPSCGQAYPIVKELLREVGEGICFVFRNFPLVNVHPHAEHAAEAAEAAGVQGAFWAMHDYLFEHQRALDDEHLREAAGALGLDTTRFARELAAHTYAPRVREDYASGALSGVSGTPTFYINGRRHDGYYDLETLRSAVAAAGRL
jgi:protein-disulfide isomerase